MDNEMLVDLVTRYQGGEDETLEVILLEVYNFVAFQCQKIIGNAEAAEQLTQEILENVADHLADVDDPANFERWLTRVIASRCSQTLDWLRWEAGDGTSGEGKGFFPDFTWKNLDEQQTAQVVTQMAEALPDEQRLCTILFCCSNMSIRRISKITGITEESVKGNLEAAQGYMKEQLSELKNIGVQFAGLAPMAVILCRAMDNSKDPDAAREMVDEVLGGGHSGGFGSKNILLWICVALIVIATILTVVFAAAFVKRNRGPKAPRPTEAIAVTTEETETTAAPTEETTEATKEETTEATTEETTEATTEATEAAPAKPVQRPVYNPQPNMPQQPTTPPAETEAPTEAVDPSEPETTEPEDPEQPEEPKDPENNPSDPDKEPEDSTGGETGEEGNQQGSGTQGDGGQTSGGSNGSEEGSGTSGGDNQPENSEVNNTPQEPVNNDSSPDPAPAPVDPGSSEE